MTELVQYNPTPLAEIEKMAEYVAKSGLFGTKTKDQAVALMMLAQAEGMHPMTAARDFDIIQGRPSKKAEAMLRDFHRAGGKVEWHTLTDVAADATFTHEVGGSFRCTWDMARAKQAGLGGKDMWLKWPRQMLRARCVSEGCKTVFPSATSGMYTPEEARDIEPMAMRDVTPERPKRQTQDPLAERPPVHMALSREATINDRVVQVTPASPIGQASAPSPQQTPASPEVAPHNDPQPRGASKRAPSYADSNVFEHGGHSGDVPTPDTSKLVLNFINADGQVIEITNRPAFLSSMEAVFIAAEPEAALDCFFANQAILNDFQSVAFDRHEKAVKERDDAAPNAGGMTAAARKKLGDRVNDARAVLDRVNAVFETAKELQKAMKG